jgi:hypothetical protein
MFVAIFAPKIASARGLLRAFFFELFQSFLIFSGWVWGRKEKYAEVF